MEEIWKPIPAYPRYMASSLGRIRGPRGATYGSLTCHGYLRTTVRTGVSGKRRETISIGKSVEEKVHRLVAMAFHPKPDGKDTVNHIDGNKTNNRADNLEWCSIRENLEHNWSVLGRNGHSDQKFLTADEVKQIRRLHDEGVTCDQIAKAMGRKYTTIYAVAKRKVWKHVT